MKRWGPSRSEHENRKDKNSHRVASHQREVSISVFQGIRIVGIQIVVTCLGALVW